MPRPTRASSIWRRAALVSDHVAGELFKMMAGVNMLHVPYRGEAPAFTDLLGGQVQVVFGFYARRRLGYIRAGKLRALAVTSANRSEALPDVPTVARIPAGLRGDRLVRSLRAEKYAVRNH